MMKNLRFLTGKAAPWALNPKYVSYPSMRGTRQSFRRLAKPPLSTSRTRSRCAVPRTHCSRRKRARSGRTARRASMFACSKQESRRSTLAIEVTLRVARLWRSSISPLSADAARRAEKCSHSRLQARRLNVIRHCRAWSCGRDIHSDRMVTRVREISFFESTVSERR